MEQDTLTYTVGKLNAVAGKNKPKPAGFKPGHPVVIAKPTPVVPEESEEEEHEDDEERKRGSDEEEDTEDADSDASLSPEEDPFAEFNEEHDTDGYDSEDYRRYYYGDHYDEGYGGEGYEGEGYCSGPEMVQDAVSEATSCHSAPQVPVAPVGTRPSAQRESPADNSAARELPITKDSEIAKSMLKQSNATEEEVAKRVKANSSKRKVDKKKSAKLDVKAQRWTEYHERLQESYGALSTVNDNENTIHQILRYFDNMEEYGPCIGATRRERWDRAQKIGLNPPEEIDDILNTVEGKTDDKYARPVFGLKLTSVPDDPVVIQGYR